MIRKDVGTSSIPSSQVRSRWGMIALAVLVAGAALSIRMLAPADLAEAQEPRSRPAPRRSATAAQPAAHAAKIAAVVNGEPITRDLLGQQCMVRWGKETLESLVNKQLITDACAQRGIVISTQDIDTEIDSIATKFGMSTEQYLKMLKTERQVTATHYRRDIVWPTIALKRLAADKLTVTKEQLAREYESEFGAKVQVRMISMTNKARAEEVLQLAKADPTEFGTLAKKYSDDTNSASAKGLIPPVRKHMGEPAIEAVVFALQPGEVSDVVFAANQYLIFRCERHVPAATISPQYRQQTDAKLRERIIERNLRTASGEIFQELQDNTKVVNVWNDAKLRSQYPGVAAFVNQKKVLMGQLMEECLARYGRDMAETEINFRLLQQELKKRNLTVTQQAINAEVARAAEAYGYFKKDGSADVDGWVKSVVQQEGIGDKEYIRDAVWPTVALKAIVGNRVKVDQDDLKKGFQANYGERVEVLAIVVSNQRIAQQVWDMARKKSTKEFFGQLAEQYSIEPVSRANFGEIPPIRRHGGQPQIEKTAFELKPGELSGIIAMGDKYIILRCLGRTKPNVLEIAEVQDELVKDIREKKLRLAMADEYERIREAAQIDNFLAGTSQSGKQQGPVKQRVQARQASTGGASARSQPPQNRRVLLQPPQK